MRLDRSRITAFLAGAAAVLGVLLLTGQGPTPSLVPPFNVDIGEGNAGPGAAGAGTGVCAVGATGNCTVQIIGPAAGGTFNSNALVNLDKRGVSCTVSAVALGGATNFTLAVQGFDAIANAWQTIAISGNLTAAATVMVYPGITGTPPAGLTLLGAVVPRVWRTQTVVNGGTTFAAKVGCNVIR